MREASATVAHRPNESPQPTTCSWRSGVIPEHWGSGLLEPSGVFRDHRQFIAVVVLNAVLIVVAVIAHWWCFLGVVLLMLASGFAYRFGHWRRQRSGVIP